MYQVIDLRSGIKVATRKTHEGAVWAAQQLSHFNGWLASQWANHFLITEVYHG